MYMETSSWNLENRQTFEHIGTSMSSSQYDPRTTLPPLAQVIQLPLLLVDYMLMALF
jgi:hypothetical protein